MPRDLIILAEDNADQRSDFTALFKKLGYEVRPFNDGASTLAALQQLSFEDQARAILVTDWIMPPNTGMDGMELAEHVRQEKIQMPIMLWSSGLQARDTKTAKRAGVDHAVGKYWDEDYVRQAIMETLSQYEARAASSAAPKGPLDHVRRSGTQERGV